jgi:hypothetical protein
MIAHAYQNFTTTIETIDSIQQLKVLFHTALEDTYYQELYYTVNSMSIILITYHC